MKFETKNKDIIYCKCESYNKKYDNNNFNCDKSISYYKGYLLHREDGPAVEYSNGDKQWLLNGIFHREDGPAMEWANGSKNWALNGRHCFEEEYLKIISLKTKKMILDEI